MSGGVDSSTTAAILHEQGYEVIGITMKLWNDGSRCCSVEDVHDAKRVAAQLGIPHYVINVKDEFEDKVVNYFVAEYMNGRTPNPCVVCNQKIKFNALLHKAKAVGANYIATGHYANIEYNPESKRYMLKRGKDEAKDQSYFLAILPQEYLSNILFPLGNYTKAEVRKIALEKKLKVAQKDESQEICFIPDTDYVSFLSQKTHIAEGKIIDRNGTVLGKHDGISNYTIGQRRRIGKPAARPFYVIKIDARNNEIIVGQEADLYSDSLIAEDTNWLGINRPKKSITAAVKIRYRHKPAPATIIPCGRNKVLVKFETSQRAITPGQLAVFYNEDRVLGAGWIGEMRNGKDESL